MDKFRNRNDDSDGDIPLLSLANRTKKIKRYTKPQTRTKQSSEGAISKNVHKAAEHLTAVDSSRYTEKRPHRITKKKKENVCELERSANSTLTTDTGDYEWSYAAAEHKYVSFYRAFMNRLFPSLFPLPTPLRWRIKSASSAGQEEKRAGKILVPTGRCSMFPHGIVLETEVGYNVTEICFPESGQTFRSK